MDIKLEKYTEELLKGYCEKNTSSKKNFNTKIDLVKKFSTNILEDHSPQSIKECKIRDSDPLINITNPISKTKEDYGNILGNIIEEECKLLDTKSKNTLSPNLLKLINFCNEKLLDFDKRPINSVENCNFKIKVFNKDKTIEFDKSALYSLFLVLYEHLRDMPPIRICKNFTELKMLYAKIINYQSPTDPTYKECKLSEYMFQTSEGNKICLTNNRNKIIDISKFIIDLYEEFCINDPSKPFIDELKLFIDSQFYSNKFNSIKPLDAENYFYLNNAGDGDCLFIAVAKYICILSNPDRNYPNTKILRNIGKDLRFETCEYMYKNRYKVINSSGTIENNTEAFIWLLTRRGDETNNDRFNSLIRCLTIKRNRSIFKNPTNYTIDELISDFKSDNLDDFTKYCILMAQYSMKSEYFLLHNSEKLQLSCYAGICEIACLSLFLNKNIICTSSSIKNADGSFKYNIGTKFSYINKFNYRDINEMPILIYLRGYKTKSSGSKSDHFEMIWSKNNNRPLGVNTPKELTDSQKALFGYDLSFTEKLIANYDSSEEITLSNEPFELEEFINGNIPSDHVEKPNEVITRNWADASIKLSKDATTLVEPHFLDAEKELFLENDKIKIEGYLYSVGYITRFTDLLEKGYVLKEELLELIIKIKSIENLNIKKPINIFLANMDDESVIKPRYENFKKENKSVLSSLIGNNSISKYIPEPSEIEYDGSVEEDEDYSLKINSDSKKWIIFGDYYYNKKYLELPIPIKNPSKKIIIRELKKLNLHILKEPIRVIENWGAAAHGEGNSYRYALYDDTGQEELEKDILHNLLKKIPHKVSKPITKIAEDIKSTESVKLVEDSKDMKPILDNITLSSTVSKFEKIKPLKDSCQKKSRKDGGLYKVAFRNALIEYVQFLYTGDNVKITLEIKKLKSMKRRKDLEEYCKTINIL